MIERPTDRGGHRLAAEPRGDEEVLQRLVPKLYGDLKRLAHATLMRARPGDTLNTTALVHEVYMRMAGAPGADRRTRDHLLAVAAKAMRQIIIDHVRRRNADKRGGGLSGLRLDETQVAILDREDVLIDLDDALASLEGLDERLGQVVECRFFAGLTEEETARAMGTSVRTVQRTWARAKGWLRKELGGMRIESAR